MNSGAERPRVISFWGPPGSPGRTTIALSVACELVMAGHSVLLLDFDTYSPSVADFLGLIDHPPGVSAAARLFGQGRLDLEQIDRLSVRFDTASGRLAILTGLSSSSRWPELGRDKVEGITAVAREHFDFVVIDISSHLESSLRQVGGAIDRNTAARASIEASDLSIAVFSCDPVGVRRLVSAFSDFDLLASNRAMLANRLRTSVLGPKAMEQVEDAVFQLCGSRVGGFIPADNEVCDRALLTMTPIALSRRTSVARRAIAQFVQEQILGLSGSKRG